MKGTLDTGVADQLESTQGKIVIYTSPNVSYILYNYSRNYTYNTDKTIKDETITGRNQSGVVVNLKRDYTYAAGSLTQVGIWAVI